MVSPQVKFKLYSCVGNAPQIIRTFRSFHTNDVICLGVLAVKLQITNKE